MLLLNVIEDLIAGFIILIKISMLHFNKFYIIMFICNLYFDNNFYYLLNIIKFRKN
jgi:hypothetical protein